MFSGILVSRIVSIGALVIVNAVVVNAVVGAVSAAGPSSTPVNGAAVERNSTIDSTSIPYTAQQAAASSARWSLLRSIPNIGAGGSITFEIDLTNQVLTSPVTLHIAAGNASTASDADFVRGLNASIAAALKDDVSFDPKTGTLTFGSKTVFPFAFAMTAGAVDANKDYIVVISDNQVGQIDIARAGGRLGALSLPSMTPLLGFNESSGEFGVGNYKFKYSYPEKDRVDWIAAQGFGIIRVPFLFQNIQASSGANLDETAMRQLDPTLDECAAKRIVCLLDMHNYGSYYQDDSPASQGLPGTTNVSNARLANLWAQIARRYKGNRYVWFDLMNEPHQQTALQWVKTGNAIAAAIRAAGATNKIIFQGTAWQGAWTWVTSGNAVQMLKAYDPGGNYAFEAHQYLDADGSGTSPICAAGSGATRLTPFTTWLKTNGVPGILGEIGWADNAGCAIEATALLDAWHAAATSTSAGGYIGLTYWAAGPWWADSYMYLAEPRPFPVGKEPAQLATLKKYLLH